MWNARTPLLLVAVFAAQETAWAAGCGLCARSVVVNSQLATCFLERFPQLASRQGGAVVVDLEDCAADRGVVAPLRGPQSPATEEPSVKFIVTFGQLACLKTRLEAAAGSLDPSLRIDLGDCE